MRLLYLLLFCGSSFLVKAQTNTPPPPMPEQEDFMFCNVQTQPYLLARTVSDTTDVYSSKQRGERALLQFLYTHLRWPEAQQHCSISGIVVISFVIDVDGFIQSSSITCRRSIAPSLDAEAARVVRLMASLGWRWQPATSRGKPMETLFNLPVRFRLE